jgi:hypothetical protein
MTIFVAGATGTVSLPLVCDLCTLGHEVTGMTHGGPGVGLLREVGASAPTTDAFNRQAVRAAMAAAAPDAHETAKLRYDAPGPISDASLDIIIQRSSKEGALVAERIVKARAGETGLVNQVA